MNKGKWMTALKLAGCLAVVIILNHIDLREVEVEAREQAIVMQEKREELRRALQIHPGEGLGQLPLGMPMDKALLTLGRPDFSDAQTGLYLYFDQGVEVEMENEQLARITLHGRTGRGYDYVPYPGVTEEGIGVHSTKTELVQAYGEPDEVREDGAYVYHDPELVVEFDSADRITAITLTQA